MWLADSSTLAETLLHFLLSLLRGQPQASRPLVAEAHTLAALYAQPPLPLQQALGHCLDALLVEMSPHPQEWGKFGIPAATLGLALVVHNCLAAVAEQPSPNETGNPVKDFTSALLATLPPAQTRDEMLAYHAVLRGAQTAWSGLTSWPANFLHAGVERSPLTALWALDWHTPEALDALASELLPGWPRNGHSPPSGVWKCPTEWLALVAYLLGDTRLARWLRHRWLAMPETRQACRNLGLLFETLRRQKETDLAFLLEFYELAIPAAPFWQAPDQGFLLEFYEAYDYFCVRTQGVWPMGETMAKLLKTPGSERTARQMNRWGHEYFLKFWPLMQIVIERNRIPTEYNLLRWEWVMALRPFLDLIPEHNRPRLTFSQVGFEESNHG